MRARILAWLSVLVVGLAACAREGSAVACVDARNFGAFYHWRSTVSSQFTPEGWREFNQAIEELRLQAMTRGVTGQAAIDQAMCDGIDGLTIGEVLRRADEAKLGRLLVLRDRIKEMLDANALLAPKPGDSVDYLDERRARQQRQLEDLNGQIEEVKTRYVRHGGATANVDRVSAVPAKLSRQRALDDFHRIIQARLEYAELHFGDWPARIDETGADLDDADRALFHERQAAAATNHHVVLPVYVRSRWWIFDATVEYPEFTDAVTANLTAQDRAAIADGWARSEAEIWARKQAAAQSPDAAIASIKAGLHGVMRP